MSEQTHLCVFPPVPVLYSSSLSFCTTYRYPNFDISRTRARIKLLTVAFEKNRFPCRLGGFIAGLWQPLVPNGLKSMMELRHMFLVTENRIPLRRYTHPAEFLREAGGARHLNSG